MYSTKRISMAQANTSWHSNIWQVNNSGLCKVLCWGGVPFHSPPPQVPRSNPELCAVFNIPRYSFFNSLQFLKFSFFSNDYIDRCVIIATFFSLGIYLCNKSVLIPNRGNVFYRQLLLNFETLCAYKEKWWFLEF